MEASGASGSSSVAVAAEAAIAVDVAVAVASTVPDVDKGATSGPPPELSAVVAVAQGTDHAPQDPERS